MSGKHKLRLGDSLTSKSLFRQMPVCFHDEAHRLTQVLAGFLNGILSHVSTRKFFNESNVTFGHLDKIRSQLHR